MCNGTTTKLKTTKNCFGVIRNAKKLKHPALYPKITADYRLVQVQ